jgi:hypothetical protein
MRLNILIFTLFITLTHVKAQFIISADTAICLGSEVTLFAAGANSSPSLVNTDDVHSDVVNIGFDFNFYGNVYNQCVLSANGYITFDFTQAGEYSPWPINAAIPDPGVVPENAILAPWHDIDPGVDGSIVFGSYGVAPNRVFYVVWCNIPMFNCNDLISGQYLLLFESSNKIEMHIEEKPLCAGWNAGAAVQGIVNENSTLSEIVIDPVLNQPRNFPLQWTATNEGWEFVPNADFTSYSIEEIPYSPITTGTISWIDQFGNLLVDGLEVTVTPEIVGDNYYYISIEDVCTGESVENADSVLIQVAPPTNAGADSTVFLCNSDNVVDLNGYLSGGHESGGEWFSPAFVSTINLLDPATAESGDYTYITYGLHPNCNDTSVVNVTIDILPYAGIEAFKLVCSDDDSFSLFDELNGNPDEGGIWFDPTNSVVTNVFNPSNSSVGQYTYFIEGLNACPSASQVVNLSYQESFTIETFTSSVTCPGVSDGSIFLIAENNTVSPITYSIDNGSNYYNYSTFNNLDFGSYSVLVKDGNGCIVDTILDVGSSQEPIQVFASSQNVPCPGDSLGQISIDTIIGGNENIDYDFSWFSSETNELVGTSETLQVSSGGYYLVAQQNSCYGTDGVIVNDYNELSYTINKSDVSCYGGEDGVISVNVNGGGTSPYSYNWLTNGGASTSDLFNLPAGLYTLELTDFNNCVTIVDVELTSPSEPLTISQITNNMSCFGIPTGEAQLDVSGGTAPYTYNWSSGHVTSYAEELLAGTYEVEVTDSRSCQVSETIVIEENSEIISNISTQEVSCFNGSDGFALISETNGGTGFYTYIWSNGFNTPNISNLNFGDYWVITQDSIGCTVIDTVFIDQPKSIKVVLTPTDALCFNDSNGTIKAEVSGGVPFLNETYTYNWSFENLSIGFNASQINNLSGSELPYQLTVTDYNGCEVNAFTFINNPEELRLDTSELVPAYCENIPTGSISVVAYGGFLNSESNYHFSWNTGELGSIISNQNSGSYNVYVEDDNECKDTLNIDIPLESTFSSTISSNPLNCFEDASGQATISVFGGFGPYTYNWNYPGGSLQSQSNLESNVKGNLPSGITSVIVSDVNGCVVTNQTNLTEPNQLFYSVFKDNDESCSGDVSACDGQFTINAFGGTGDYSFSWFDLEMNLMDSITTAGISAQANNLCSGFYQFTVMDERGCFALESGNGIVVPSEIVSGYQVQSMIDLNLYSNDIICFGDTSAFVQVMNPNPSFSYTWNLNGQPYADGLSTSIPAGSITLDASYQDCHTTSTDLMINQPDPTMINSTLEVINCYGENTGFIETETINPQGLTYSWSNGSTDQSIYNLSAGNYTLTTTNNFDCQTDFEFSLSEPMDVSVIPTVIDVSCFGESDGEVSLEIAGGSAPFTVDWQGSDPFNLEVGQYQFLITDNSNCVDTVSVQVNGPSEISASFNSSSSPFNATANGGTPPYTYQWLYYGNIVASGSSYVPTESGMYSLLVTDVSDCEGRSLPQNYTQSSVAIDHSIQNSFNIYPNPMTTKLVVELKGNNTEELKLKLIDSKGSLVYETIFKNETIIERDNFSNGVYSLIITGRSTQIIEKIIISDLHE